MSGKTTIGPLWTSAAAAFTALLSIGCDSSVLVPIEDKDVVIPRYQTLHAVGPVTGIWWGVVTHATDLNNASFGRSPSEWVGKMVRGTFAVHIATAGIGDRDPDPDVWVLGPVPGPGPFVEFVTVTAMIDGQVFQTSRSDYQTIFFGDVVGIVDTDVQSAFNPQDSFVGAGAAGTGRSVIGFNTLFAPGGLSFNGTELSLNSSMLQFGHGSIDDLLDDGGTIHRQGTISFNVTAVSVSPIGTLMEDVLQLAELLQQDQLDALLNKLDEIEMKLAAGNTRSACHQLSAFIHQVRAIISGGHLTPEIGQPLINEASLLEDGLAC